MRGLALLLCLIWPALAGAESIVAGLSQTQVAITARFAGSEILVYGAVRRDAPVPASPPLGVIVTVEGPATPVIVRQKSREFGIWVNTQAVEIDRAPSFYAVASTGPLAEQLSDTEDLRHRITIARAIRAVGIASEGLDSASFVDALIRIREQAGAYRELPGSVSLTEETLLRTDVALPANLIEGDYRVRIYLTRGGKVIDTQERKIFVRKAGLERWLANLSRQEPLIYGLLSLALAVVAGWGASAAFRFRQN